MGAAARMARAMASEGASVFAGSAIRAREHQHGIVCALAQIVDFHTPQLGLKGLERHEKKIVRERAGQASLLSTSEMAMASIAPTHTGSTASPLPAAQRWAFCRRVDDGSNENAHFYHGTPVVGP